MPSSEMNIFTSVRQLDLRSVKGVGADKKRSMLNERKTAISVIASVPHPVSPQGRPATAAAGGARGFAGGGGAVPGSAGRPAAHLGHLAELRSEQLAAAEAAASQALQKVAVLEDSLARTVSALSEVVGATETKASPYYVVAFPAGAIGMILSSRSTDGAVVVNELRSDKDGKPLLAKASGKVALGDEIVSINNTLLSRHGTPTLDSVQGLFKSATRPVHVLFHRSHAEVAGAK